MQGWVDLGIGYIPKSRPIGSKVAMDSYSACRTEIASKSFRYDMRHTNNHHFTCHQRWATPVFTPQPQSITAVCSVLIAPTPEGWPGWVDLGGLLDGDKLPAAGHVPGCGHASHYQTAPAYRGTPRRVYLFYRAKQLCYRGLENRNSIRLSVTRVLCDQTKADILIPYKGVITLVSWHQHTVGWWAMSHYTWNLRLKLYTPSDKRRLRQISAYNVWTVRASEKCSMIAIKKSSTCFQTSYKWNAYVTPNSPKGWLRNRFCRFCNAKIQV